jgi:hypothetical protein
MNHNRCHSADQLARETFKKYHQHYPEDLSEKDKKMFNDIDSVLGIYRKTRVFCSDPMCCGNPRRSGLGRTECLTRQELKADLDFEEQLDELKRTQNV